MLFTLIVEQKVKSLTILYTWRAAFSGRSVDLYRPSFLPIGSQWICSETSHIQVSDSLSGPLHVSRVPTFMLSLGTSVCVWSDVCSNWWSWGELRIVCLHTYHTYVTRPYLDVLRRQLHCMLQWLWKVCTRHGLMLVLSGEGPQLGLLVFGCASKVRDAWTDYLWRLLRQNVGYQYILAGWRQVQKSKHNTTGNKKPNLRVVVVVVFIEGLSRKNQVCHLQHHNW